MNHKQSLSWMYQGEEALRKEREDLEKEDYLLGNKKINDKIAEDDVARLRKNEAAGAIFLNSYNKETEVSKKIIQNHNDPLFQLQLKAEKMKQEKEKKKQEKRDKKEQKKKRKLEKLEKQEDDTSHGLFEHKEKKRKLSDEEKKQKLEEMRKDAEILQKTRLESQIEQAEELEQRSKQKSDSIFLNKVQKEAYWNPSKKHYK